VKKWTMGIGLIILGVLVSFGVSYYIIEAEIFMLHPKYKGILLGSVLGIPMVLYGGSYAWWYHRCAKQKSRIRSAYKGQFFWMLVVVIVEFSALFLVFETAGLMNVASIHYISSCLIPTIFFCIAFLLCKPF